MSYNNEGGLGGKLNFLGKLCRFIEEFYGLKLADEDFRSLLEYDNIMGSENFKSGYDYADVLIKNGWDYIRYNSWLFDVESKHINLYALYKKLESNIRGKVDFKRDHFKR